MNLEGHIVNTLSIKTVAMSSKRNKDTTKKANRLEDYEPGATQAEIALVVFPGLGVAAPVEGDETEVRDRPGLGPRVARCPGVLEGLGEQALGIVVSGQPEI